MVNIHDAEREVGAASGAYAFLLAVESVAVRSVIRQFALVGAQGRFVQRDCATPQAAIPKNAVVYQFDGKRRKVDAYPAAA